MVAYPSFVHEPIGLERIASERLPRTKPHTRTPSARNGSTPAPDLADQVFEELVRLFWGARRWDQSLQRKHGVTSAQLSALRVLERQGALTQTELSARLFVSGSTLSGLLTRLEERALIARERPAEDRRTVEVRLTAEGQRQLARVPRGQNKFGALRALLRGLPEAEVKRFLGTLRKMVGLLDQDAAKGADG